MLGNLAVSAHAVLDEFLAVAAGLVGYGSLLAVWRSLVLPALGEQRGPWQPLLQLLPWELLWCYRLILSLPRNAPMALLKHATDVSSSENPVLFMCPVHGVALKERGICVFS